jgi:Na+/H+ antiporter NhaA
LRVGPAVLHLDLTLAQWAADGLLAIFFFVAGLELKREFVAGDLRVPAALRTFLLTLAVVDDLLAITIIALFYTSSLVVLPLAMAPVPPAVGGGGGAGVRRVRQRPLDVRRLIWMRC